MKSGYILHRILCFSFFLPLVGACVKHGPEDGGETGDLVLVTAISLSENEVSIPTGGSVKIVATVEPKEAINAKVHWSSSEEAVATVTTSGLVRAVSPGKTVITAKAGDLSATCTVTVEKDAAAVTGISIDKAYMALSIGETSPLVISFIPSDAKPQTVSWESSAPNVATVSSDGLVTGAASGQTTVTASVGSFKASCQVVVLPQGPDNTIEYTSIGGVVVKPFDESAFGATIVSNTYEGGKGVIVFDKPVTEIGNKAFYQCGTLQTISLPKTIKKIGDATFQYCSVLSGCVIQTGVESIGDYAFAWCSSLMAIVLPDTVSELGSSAFRSCAMLQKFHIPEKVSTLNGYLFYECSGLQMLYCTRLVPPSVGSRALENIGNCLIYVRASSLDAYKEASGWKKLAGSIRAIPE